MTFVTVPAAVTGQKYSASQHNTYVKDNLAELWKYSSVGTIAYATSATTLSVISPVSASYHLYSNGNAPQYVTSLGPHSIQVKIVADDTNVTTGAGAFVYIPSAMNTRRLASMYAYVTTAGATGNTIVSVRNLTAYPDNDISYIPAIITPGNTRNTNDAGMDINYYQVATNDKLYIFVGMTSVTPPKGLQVLLFFT